MANYISIEDDFNYLMESDDEDSHVKKYGMTQKAWNQAVERITEILIYI